MIFDGPGMEDNIGLFDTVTISAEYGKHRLVTSEMVQLSDFTKHMYKQLYFYMSQLLLKL